MQIYWIEPNKIAVNHAPNEGDLRSLHEQGIRAIVSLTEKPIVDADSELLDKLDIVYYHAAIKDFHAPTIPQTLGILEFIEQMEASGRPVYMHCFAGLQRTGTILHAYYLLKGEPLKDVKTRIKVARPMSSFDSLTNVQQEFLLRLCENAR